MRGEKKRREKSIKEKLQRKVKRTKKSIHIQIQIASVSSDFTQCFLKRKTKKKRKE